MFCHVEYLTNVIVVTEMWVCTLNMVWQTVQPEALSTDIKRDSTQKTCHEILIFETLLVLKPLVVTNSWENYLWPYITYLKFYVNQSTIGSK